MGTGGEISAGSADRLAPRCQQREQVVEIVAAGADRGPHLAVGRHLDLLAQPPPGFSELGVVSEDPALLQPLGRGIEVVGAPRPRAAVRTRGQAPVEL